MILWVRNSSKTVGTAFLPSIWVPRLGLEDPRRCPLLVSEVLVLALGWSPQSSPHGPSFFRLPLSLASLCSRQPDIFTWLKPVSAKAEASGPLQAWVHFPPHSFGQYQEMIWPVQMKGKGNSHLLKGDCCCPLWK